MSCVYSRQLVTPLLRKGMLPGGPGLFSSFYGRHTCGNDSSDNRVRKELGQAADCLGEKGKHRTVSVCVGVFV